MGFSRPDRARKPNEGEALDLKELKEILQILEEKEITEFELEEEGMKLRIRKGPVPSNHAGPPGALSAAVPAVPPSPPPGPRAAAEPAPVAPEAEAGLTLVKSPIVGTFYRTPD